MSGAGDDADRESAPPPEDAPASAPRARPPSAREAVSLAFGVTIASGAVLTYAFDPRRAGEPAILGSIGGLYALITVVTLVRLYRRGELYARFRPVSGDMTFGAVTAGLLYGAGRIVALLFATHGSPREAWIVRLYLQIGDLSEGRGTVAAAVFAVAALEEIVWRGLVMRTLGDAMGARKGLVYSSLLFALAHVPTVVLLRDPTAGLNPLVVVAALGCSLVWGAMVLRTERLVPALVAHALFSWSIIQFPMWLP
jgi:membrane protease YdiL (CAAX protease family)